MNIEPIAFFRSPFGEKFGVPKQSGLVESLCGQIVFEPQYRNPDFVRGIDGFDYLWLVWGFSANPHAAASALVRPPLLGGNERMGVFATRSPFRPNPIGLSSVRLERVELDAADGPTIHVLGADLMDGTPIYDIKPYVSLSDCHPDARCGFVDRNALRRLKVEVKEQVRNKLTESDLENLIKVLELDPRPHYHNDAERVYGMSFMGHNVKFRVDGETLFVMEI